MKMQSGTLPGHTNQALGLPMLSSQMVQDSRGQHRAPGSEYCEKVRSVPSPLF